MPLDASLASLFKRVGARRGIPATLYHDGPDAAAMLASCPATGDAALRAARMQMIEALPYPASSNPVSCSILGRDASGEAPRTHVLAAADRDDRAQSLYGFLVRAGCRPVVIAPMEAPLIAAAARAVLDESCRPDDVLVLLGERHTVISAGTGGNLRCLRSFDLGYDLLLEALVRAFHPAGHAAPPTTGERERAREFLHTRGIPSPDDVIDASSGLRGSVVLPLLQPIIQRYVVETRQTIRFGMSHSDLSKVRLVLSGPGGRIPRLAELLSNHLDAEAVVSEDAPTHDAGACSAFLRACVERPVPALNLLPMSAEARRVAGVLAVGVRAGAVAAGLLLAADGARIAHERAKLDRLMHANAPIIESIDLAAEIDRRAGELAARLADAEASLAATLGEYPDWFAMLRQIAAVASDDVRLLEVTGEVGRDGPALTVRGIALAGASAEGQEPLSRYLEALAASPLTRSVQLASTRNTVMDDAPARSFVLRAQLHGLPHPIVVAGEGGR
ncbi:MAG TPA: hypothetical protein PLU35_07035 [Phycisphaerales bacterium]|nr:hypothetical protein [Phycisphaerales bacterium]